MIFDDELKRREVPPLSFASRDDFENSKPLIKELLQKNEYGYIPQKPEHLSFLLSEEDSRFAAGKARMQKLKATLYNGNSVFSFPFTAVIPNIKGKMPAFVYIDSENDIPNKYLPIEEICDSGFAVFSFRCSDVAPDSAKIKGQLPSFLGINRRISSAPGKIALWAYVAMRIMDHIETLDFIDKDNVAVIGHSRFGKAALVAAAFDERFRYAISNNSGCAGAAITRGKSGESAVDITNRFPYLFCPKYTKYADKSENAEFDQNFLLALIPPRNLLIGSAEEDLWSDPESEFLGAYSVSHIYGLYGKSGLVHSGKLPTARTVLDKGDICYHIRHGDHYLSREDWQIYMNFIKLKMEEKL